MSDAWVLLAARSRRLAAGEDALAAAIDPVRRCLSGPTARGTPIAQVIGAGRSAREVGLIAGLSVSVPAWSLQGGSLQALGAATHAVAGGFDRQVLVTAVSGPSTPPGPASPRLTWAFEAADDSVGGDRLRDRHGMSDPVLQAWVDQRVERRHASPPRPRLQGGGDIDVAHSVCAARVEAAAAVRLVDDDAAAASPFSPRARIAAVCGAGVDPADPLRAPQAAAAAALERAGLAAHQIDAWAIAAPHAAVAFDLTAAFGLDPDRLDPEGGALARGHAGAATGLVELVDLLDHLDDTQGRFGLVVETAPWGLATAVILDREVWA